MQSCDASHFILRVKTDKATYSIGETVHIALTIMNKGPSCVGTLESGPCVDGATVSNSSGQVVWVSNPGPLPCPISEPETVPHGWSDSDSASWSQKECPALGSQCTNDQVPPGKYSVVGKWGVSDPAVQSKPVKITVASSPGQGRFLFSPAHVAKTITVTEADNGHHYVLHKGDSLVVELSGLNLIWTEPSSSNETVLDRMSGSSGTAAKATFLAASIGSATVNAMGYPNCSPPGGCPEYILGFMVSITVRS